MDTKEVQTTLVKEEIIDAKPKAPAEIKTEAKPVEKAKPKEIKQKSEPKKEIKSEAPKQVEKAKVAKLPEAKAIDKNLEEKKGVKPEVKVIEKEKKPVFNFKLFGIWDVTGIVVEDAGLRRYLNLVPVLAPVSAGRGVMKQFWKSKKNIVERLINKIMQTGHRGKKHRWTSMWYTGQKATAMKIVISALKLVESKTKKNPVEVLVRAIEKGSPKEGTTQIEYGGVRYPKAVDLSPQRRIDLVLRWLTQGANEAAHTSKAKISYITALADQIIATAGGDAKAMALAKKTDTERQATVSR